MKKVLPDQPDKARRVAVVGAGLAGCALAESFSRRGWAVSILEAGAAPGGAVAGVPLLAQHPALTPDFDLRSQLLLRAMQWHASLRAGPAADLAPAFEACGRWQPMALAEARRCVQHAGVAGLAQAVRQRGAADDAAAGGIWFPLAAAVSPAAWWRQVLQRAGITLRTGVAVAGIMPAGSAGWRLLGRQGETLAEADILVLACREQSFALAGMDERAHGRLRISAARVWTARADGGPPGEDPGAPPLLPISGGRGLALTRPGSFWLRSEAHHQHWLQTGIRDEEAWCQPADWQLQPGSSDAGTPRLPGPAPGSPDRLANGMAEDLRQFLDRPECWHPGAIGERLQLRDNLPMIGPVPDRGRIAAEADALARNDRLPLPRRNGLYLLTGLGGRGALYAAIGAEMIAAAVCAEPAPVAPRLARAVDPARFIKRELQRAWSRRSPGRG